MMIIVAQVDDGGESAGDALKNDWEGCLDLSVQVKKLK